jgi:hypothetical protein
MNSERYQTQVLDAHLFDFYQQMSEERGLVFFQQDGAPVTPLEKHTRVASTKLSRHFSAPCIIT